MTLMTLETSQYIWHTVVIETSMKNLRLPKTIGNEQFDKLLEMGTTQKIMFTKHFKVAIYYIWLHVCILQIVILSPWTA